MEYLGLVPAIRSLVNDLRDNKIVVELEQTGTEKRLEPKVELALYRITQEALNNIRLHAQASQVRVDIGFGSDNVQITVQDNGRGFVAPRGRQDLVSLGRLGLIGMDERAQSLGGSVRLRSKPGQGTTVTAIVPTVEHPPNEDRHKQVVPDQSTLIDDSCKTIL